MLDIIYKKQYVFIIWNDFTAVNKLLSKIISGFTRSLFPSLFFRSVRFIRSACFRFFRLVPAADPQRYDSPVGKRAKRSPRQKISEIGGFLIPAKRRCCFFFQMRYPAEIADHFCLPFSSDQAQKFSSRFGKNQVPGHKTYRAENDTVPLSDP